jgi:hypothetical protein
MITISFQLSEQDFQTLVDDYCVLYNYQERTPDYNKTSTVENPESKAEFTRRMLIQEVANKVKDIESKKTPLITIV